MSCRCLGQVFEHPEESTSPLPQTHINISTFGGYLNSDHLACVHIVKVGQYAGSLMKVEEGTSLKVR